MPGLDTLLPVPQVDFVQEPGARNEQQLGVSLEALSKIVGDLAFTGALGDEKLLQSEEALIDANTKCSGCTQGCDTGRCV